MADVLAPTWEYNPLQNKDLGHAFLANIPDAETGDFYFPAGEGEFGIIVVGDKSYINPEGYPTVWIGHVWNLPVAGPAATGQDNGGGAKVYAAKTSAGVVTLTTDPAAANVKAIVGVLRSDKASGSQVAKVRLYTTPIPVGG